MLSSGFAEGTTNSATVIRPRASPSEYDYESDSDLDEFEELESGVSPGQSCSDIKGKSKESPTEEIPLEAVAGHHHVLIPSVAYRT